MDFKKIKYAVTDSVATISLDSPKNLNAFDEPMIDELVAAFQICEKDANVRVVILNSTSKAFSAGGDIGSMYQKIKSGNLDFGGSIEKMAQVSLAIKKLSKPVVAALCGAVAGAGFNVALACDYCIAAENATFIQAFVNIALIPDAGGQYLLTRAVGVNKATELALTGRPVFAQEAKQLGFVAEVVPVEELDAKVAGFAKKLAAGPSTSYAQLKRLVMESEFKGFEEFIKEEVKSQIICGQTDDFKEGVCAFVEKRRPSFR